MNKTRAGGRVVSDTSLTSRELRGTLTRQLCHSGRRFVEISWILYHFVTFSKLFSKLFCTGVPQSEQNPGR